MTNLRQLTFEQFCNDNFFAQHKHLGLFSPWRSWGPACPSWDTAWPPSTSAVSLCEFETTPLRHGLQLMVFYFSFILLSTTVYLVFPSSTKNLELSTALPLAWSLNRWNPLIKFFTSCHMNKHCQRHNGPGSWVKLTKVTSLGHITSSYKSWSNFTFRI